MNLYNRFEKFLTDEIHLQSSNRILLAVSGGVDSMVMLDLFLKTNFEFGVAHCNFGLRGEESDADHTLVKEYCSDHNITFFEKYFDTQHFIALNKTGVQETARNLRYDWFNQVSADHDFDYIATAHQMSDVLETILFNITRGTGIAGLHGIAAKNKNLIRPLLFAKRNEIEVYAEHENIGFRTDSSNASNKYSRNKIRNFIVPVLKDINPLAEDHFFSLSHQVSFIEKIFYSHISEEWNSCHTIVNGKIEISIPSVLKLDPAEKYLYEFLAPYGYNSNQVTDIFLSFTEQSGKEFHSPSHILIKDRNTLVLTKQRPRENMEFTITEDDEKIQLPGADIILEKITSKAGIRFAEHTFFFDSDKLIFPLTLRKWRDGDKFMPLGMNDLKKISDFFIDEKINVIDKSASWILINNDNETICVLPYRIDDRFKLTPETVNIIRLTFVFK